MKAGILRIIAFVLLLSGGFLLADGCWIRTKAVLAQFLLQHAWEQTLASGKETRPWPWADTWPVARLQVKRLGVDLIVLEGESGEVLAFGPGHLSGSSAPGDNGHCILAGHRDTSFRFLQDLQQDDIVTMQASNGVLQSYRVRGKLIHEAEDLYLRESGFSSLTLLTCYPFDTLQSHTSLRYLVFADNISG
jgi:sortase A